MAYRWVDHTAELELHLAAPSEAAVFEEALLAFRELIGGEAARDAVSFDVQLAAPDRSALLVRWLDELVYRAETEDLVPERLESIELGGDELVAKVRALRDHPRHIVKGVTYHGLTFERAADGYRASVVLDV